MLRSSSAFGVQEKKPPEATKPAEKKGNKPAFMPAQLHRPRPGINKAKPRPLPKQGSAASVEKSPSAAGAPDRVTCHQTETETCYYNLAEMDTCSDLTGGKLIDWPCSLWLDLAEVDPTAMSVKDLKAYLEEHSVSIRGVTDKSELVTLAIGVKEQIIHANTGASSDPILFASIQHFSFRVWLILLGRVLH